MTQTEFRIPEIEKEIDEAIQNKKNAIAENQREISEYEQQLEALKGKKGKKAQEETRDIINNIEYEKRQIAETTEELATGKGIYYIRGRLSDNKVLKTYYPNITAYLKNEFGYAFILRGKVDFFCFIFLTCDSLGYETNFRLRKIDRERFYKEFGDKLTIINQDDYAKFKAKLLLQNLTKERENA